MSGGFYAKIGDWYEQDYVCLLWLRLLGGRVHSVTWEPAGQDERGVDAWTEEGARRIAHQCKSRETGNWTPAALVHSRLLAHARDQLERDGGAQEFRFVTTTDAPILRGLIEWAGPVQRAQDLTDDQRALVVQALGSDLTAPRDEARLRDLLSRIRVEVLGSSVLTEHIRDLATQLVGEEAELLVSELVALRSREILRRELHADQLRARLPAALRWRHSVDSAPLLERVAALRRQYIEDVLRRRRIEPPVERSEVGRLLALFRSGVASRTLLVHGAAGAGKSDVLAAAVQEWSSDDGVIVPVLADEVDVLVSGDISLEKLALAAGSGRVAILVDQLDQLLGAGSETQRRLREVTRLLSEARRLGCTVIVGCRTTDADFDTQLHQLLYGDGERIVEKLEVQDLPEDAVTRELSRAGVAWNTLGPDVQRLVRRPLCLGLVLELTSVHGWQGSRSLHELVEAWWQRIAAGGAGKVAALDALIAQMESSGVLGVDALLLSQHRVALEALVRDRVLERDSRHRIRPVHQVLIDMRLAQQLGRCASIAAVRERLGARFSQDVHQARRLRHAVTIFANRDKDGAAILDALYRSSEVRVLLKRAMLLGLRDERAPLRSPLVRVVLGWLEEPTEVDLVSGALLRGHGDWMIACREWIERAWSAGDRARQYSMLHLLSSVSVQNGDFVAALLKHWARNDAEVLDRAQWIFWHDPSEDSDTLFQMRMAAPGSVGLPHEHVDWSRLFRSNADRAAVLLAAVLRKADVDLTRSFATGGYRLPLRSTFPDSALVAARRLWAELRDWWRQLSIESIRLVMTGEDDVRAPIVDLVDILARCLSHQLDHDELSWDELVEHLPEPLRPLDAWLLLETGARLGCRTPAPVEAAAQWLIREERFADLRIGWQGGRFDYELLRAYISAIGPHLSEDIYTKLETWILDYREEWTVEDEAQRFEAGPELGTLWPNRRGLLAYRVLPALPMSRLSSRARARWGELNRKFGPVATTMLAPPESIGGVVTSKVPNEVLLRLSPQQWIARLRAAPAVDRDWLQVADEQVALYNKEMLVRQLGMLARAHPNDFLPVAEALATADPPFEDGVYSVLLSSIGSVHPVGTTSEPRSSTPVDDERVARLACLPRFLQNDDASIDLGRVVGERAAFDWPDPVVERLLVVALVEQDPLPASAIPRRARVEPLIELQFNDASCVAVRALTALAVRHAHRHGRFLDVADRLVDVGPPARRAAAGVLALACSSSDRGRACDLLLRACEDPHVAANYDCLRGLFLLLSRSDTPPQAREKLLRILLQLPSVEDTHVAERGGHAAIALRYRGLIDDRRLRELLHATSDARKGAAEALGRSLLRGEQEPWIRDYILDLANDDVEGVGDTILRFAASRRNRGPLHDYEFASGLVASRAGQRKRSLLLAALDEEAHLEPAVPLIFELAASVLAASPGGEVTQDSWVRYEEARNLGGLLARLVEECERNGDDTTRSRALDAWDRLIEARPFDLGPLLREKTA